MNKRKYLRHKYIIYVSVGYFRQRRATLVPPTFLCKLQWRLYHGNSHFTGNLFPILHCKMLESITDTFSGITGIIYVSISLQVYIYIYIYMCVLINVYHGWEFELRDQLFSL